jgi:hypothetical protein
MTSSCGENPSFTETQGEVVPTTDDIVADPSQGSGDGSYDPETGLYLGSDKSVVKDQSKVDILWIVDSSGSMSEEQSYLGQNFSSFMTQLLASGVDFQTGITTTDVCSTATPSSVPMAERYCPQLSGSSNGHYRGSLVGTNGSRVLTATTPSIIQKFLQYSNVGTQGSGFEHGLKAAEMAVEKSLAGNNEGLVRPDAFLAVIVVSDEEDDGIGLSQTDAYSGKNHVALGQTSVYYTDDHFISNLNTVKGVGKYSVSTITGTRLGNGNMCSSAHSSPLEEGTQYIKAATKTGGIVQSICDTNWSSSLANIGKDIAAQSAQVSLSYVPKDGSIKVFVSGVENSHWTHSSGNKFIKFEAGFIPQAGAEVEVKYLYAK